VLAERIVSVLRQPIRLADQNIALSVSVGVVVAGPGTTVDRLMSEADAAMYEAKTSSKNRVAVFETFMRSRLIEKMAVVNGFSGALRHSEFLLEFQPHFGLADNRLSGFECLVRWQHPTLGLIGPGRFIAIAEETRFILELGSWILLSACRHAAAWPTTDISADSSKNGRSAAALTVSVNLSGWQLQDPDLLQIVREALEISDLPPERLILEVTENVAARGSGAHRVGVADLARIGHPDSDRRLRYRLFLAQSTPAIARRHIEDRQIVHRPTDRPGQ